MSIDASVPRREPPASDTAHLFLKYDPDFKLTERAPAGADFGRAAGRVEVEEGDEHTDLFDERFDGDRIELDAARGEAYLKPGGKGGPDFERQPARPAAVAGQVPLSAPTCCVRSVRAGDRTIS